jgi:sugar (pentulose or hexulose) kinase
MGTPCTLIFDIGKTNKKLFLFDDGFNVIVSENTVLTEISDDDGFPADDLSSIVSWIKIKTDELINNPEYDIKAINFTTYGASLVHLDPEGNVVAPFYNYLKPYPEDLKNGFFENYYGEEEFSLITSSPSLGMLNSGLQLYFIKNRKPHLFKKIYKSLHFPQYLSYLLTNQLMADYTSIGCNTGMWDFKDKSYVKWLEDEDLINFLSPVIASSTNFPVEIRSSKVNVGVGVHDSSSALVPYLETFNEPFVLLSTGTWNICLNPFTSDALTESELNADCLQFLDKNGNPVKASRLFLGKQLEVILKRLVTFYSVDKQSFKNIQWNENFKPKKHSGTNLLFNYDLLKPEILGYVNNPNPDYSLFDNYEEAYFNLIDEMTDVQIASLRLSIGNSQIKNIIVEGGFGSNEAFIKMLSQKLPEFNIYSSSAAIGTALGAALLVNDKKLSKGFIKDNYRLKDY